MDGRRNERTGERNGGASGELRARGRQRTNGGGGSQQRTEEEEEGTPHTHARARRKGLTLKDGRKDGRTEQILLLDRRARRGGAERGGDHEEEEGLPSEPRVDREGHRDLFSWFMKV